MMSNDMMARCGIMHHTMCLLDNRFCGRMFVIHRPGFTFSQYMEMMFRPTMMQKRSMSMMRRSMLDEVPEIDVSMAEKREFTAQGMSSPLRPMMMQMMKKMGGEEMMMDGKIMDSKMDGMRMKNEKRSSWNMSGNDCVAMARMCAQECEGKTLRQLSRLWRYADGARPMGEGVNMSNGVGLGVDMGVLDGHMMDGSMTNGMMDGMDGKLMKAMEGKMMDAKIMNGTKMDSMRKGGKAQAVM